LPTQTKGIFFYFSEISSHFAEYSVFPFFFSQFCEVGELTIIHKRT